MMYFHGKDGDGRPYLVKTSDDASVVTYELAPGMKQIGFLEYRLRLIIMQLKELFGRR